MKSLRFSTLLGIYASVAFIFAAMERDLAAAYVVLFGCAALRIMHSVEVKLNKLLDHYELRVTQRDVDEA